MSRLWVPLVLAAALGVTDPGSESSTRRHDNGFTFPEAKACHGVRTTPESAVQLRHGAFPGSDHPDVAFHIPPGFDPMRRPGLVLYFHGWQGCIAAALSGEAIACSDGGLLHPGADLARQLDAARVNALLVAVELRVDLSSGEPGQLAMPAGARDLLRELLAEHVSPALGCPLEVDALDRIVVVAHSGGYQAVAGVLAEGDLPQITEVDLLDALYGAQDVFARWIADDAARFDPRTQARLRFVDLYTCCGGTADASQSLAELVADALDRAGVRGAIAPGTDDRDLDRVTLASSIVFQRVPERHEDLPRTYFRPLLEAAGFARVSAP